MSQFPKTVIVYGETFTVFNVEFLPNKNQYLWTLAHQTKIKLVDQVPRGYQTIPTDDGLFYAISNDEIYYLITNTIDELTVDDPLDRSNFARTLRQRLQEVVHEIFDPILFFKGSQYVLQSADFDPEHAATTPSIPCRALYQSSEGHWLIVTQDITKYMPKLFHR